ncbi:MAG: hypothetical protein WDN44_00660 [Sphingomonas sp.]
MAILYADGSDGAVIDAVAKAVTGAGARAVFVSPRVGGAKLADGSVRKADGQLQGMPSQLFDAVALVLTDAGTADLLGDSAAVEFVMNAFGHLKAIGASDAAKPLLDKAGVVPDAGITGLGKDFVGAAAKRFYDREPALRRLA